MTKILAVDIGTASVSAALAEKHANGKFFVCDFWRLPYDISDAENAGRILLKNLKKIFYETHKFYPKTKKIAISFSALFCSEKIISAEFERDNPSLPIRKDEFENTIEILKNQSEDSSGIQQIDILETKINGYGVENPMGHKGENMQMKASLLILAPAFKNNLEELKDKFFPSGNFRFFSDSAILKKAVLNLFSPTNDFTILDIGGETTARDDFVFSFGVRAVERRMGAVLSRFSSGHLDYPQERAQSKILKLHAENLGDILERHSSKKIFLTGGGANFPYFFEAAKKKSVAEVIKLEAKDFDKFFLKLGPLHGGEDAVLAALITL